MRSLFVHQLDITHSGPLINSNLVVIQSSCYQTQSWCDYCSFFFFLLCRLLLFHDSSPVVKKSRFRHASLFCFVCVAQFVVPICPNSCIYVLCFFFFFDTLCWLHLCASHLLLFCRLPFGVALIEFLDGRPGLKRSTRDKRNFALQHQRGASALSTHSTSTLTKHDEIKWTSKVSVALKG